MDENGQSIPGVRQRNRGELLMIEVPEILPAMEIECCPSPDPEMLFRRIDLPFLMRAAPTPAHDAATRVHNKSLARFNKTSTPMSN